MTTSSMPDLGRLARAAGPTGPTGPTVPMPPRRWATRVALPTLILLAFGAIWSHAARDALWPPQPVTVIPVVVKSGGEATAGPGFQAAGWCEPDPFPIYAAALTDGVIDKLLVLEGQTVKKGDVIAHLVDDDARLKLRRAKAEVARRAAELALAEATLTAAKRDFDNPIDRQRRIDVAVQAHAELEAQLIELTAKSSVARARVAQAADRLKRQRDARARNKDAVTEAALEQSRLALEVAKAELAAIESGRPVLAARKAKAAAEEKAARAELTLRIRETRAVAEATAARDRAAAQLKAAQAHEAEDQLQLDRTKILSPIDGVVMNRMRSPGDIVMTRSEDAHMAHVCHLYEPGKLQVRVDVPLADAARVGVGMKARIVVEILPERTFEGVVTRTVHEANIQKNTLQVKVRIDDPPITLKPEMLARVEFIPPPRQRAEGESHLATFAPRRLVYGEGETAHVWIAAGGTAVRKSVEIGPTTNAGWVELIGLRPGDKLIATDPSALTHGMRIDVVGEGRE